MCYRKVKLTGSARLTHYSALLLFYSLLLSSWDRHSSVTDVRYVCQSDDAAPLDDHHGGKLMSAIQCVDNLR